MLTSFVLYHCSWEARSQSFLVAKLVDLRILIKVDTGTQKILFCSQFTSVFFFLSFTWCYSFSTRGNKSLAIARILVTNLAVVMYCFDQMLIREMLIFQQLPKSSRARQNLAVLACSHLPLAILSIPLEKRYSIISTEFWYHLKRKSRFLSSIFPHAFPCF